MSKKISSLDLFIKKTKEKELSGINNCTDDESINMVRFLFRHEITRAYEMAVHDTVNFSINKDNQDELDIYKNKYYDETYVDGYLLSEEEINQCRDIKDVLKLRNKDSLIPNVEKITLLNRIASDQLGKLFSVFIISLGAVIFIPLTSNLILGVLALDTASFCVMFIGLFFVTIGIFMFNYYNKNISIKKKALSHLSEKYK